MAILVRINEKIVDGLDDLRKRFRKGRAVPMVEYLDGHCVEFLTVAERNAALERLVGLLVAEGYLEDGPRSLRAVLDREAVVSTAVGAGVAIPHAKLPGLSQFGIAIGLIQGPGIPWGAFDGQPVRLIFLIVGPSDQQTEYLRILSQLTALIRDDVRRQRLLKAVDVAEVLAALE